MSLQKPVEYKVSPAYLFRCAAVGISLFWLVGVWLLPERHLVLENFRGYIAVGFVLTLFGAYVHESGHGVVRGIGKGLLGSGFGAVGAFFAMCFYLVMSFTFYK